MPMVVGVDGEGKHSLNHSKVLPGALKVKKHRRWGTRTELEQEGNQGWKRCLGSQGKNVAWRRGWWTSQLLLRGAENSTGSTTVEVTVDQSGLGGTVGAGVRLEWVQAGWGESQGKQFLECWVKWGNMMRNGATPEQRRPSGRSACWMGIIQKRETVMQGEDGRKLQRCPWVGPKAGEASCCLVTKSCPTLLWPHVL